MGKKTKNPPAPGEGDARPPQRKEGIDNSYQAKKERGWYKGEIKKPKAVTYTLKQRMFIQEYLRTGNASEAYRVAYDGKPENASGCAYRLIRQPKIANAINQALEEADFTEEFAASTLKRIVQKGSDDNALKSASPANAIAGLKLFAKMKGYLDDRRLEEKESIKEQYQRKTIQELKSEIRSLNKREGQLLAALQDAAEEGEIIDD